MPEPIHTNGPSELADHDLLRRFVLDADESAFAEIVRRYQRLVMGICRRVAGDRTDAEDAFQAVFVALARRPRSIRRTTSLSNWLYTVTWRTSHRLVRKRRRQSMDPLTHPVPSDDPDPLDQIAADQNADVLHTELNLLPDRYRQVLVMSYFAQQTSKQIADQLQITKGAVDGRIREARNILRVRLARRGVALSVLTLVATALHNPEAVAAASPGLLQSTIHLGNQTLTNSVPGTTDLSHIEPLIRPEFATMNLKLGASLGACLALVVGAAGMAQIDAGNAFASAQDETPEINAVSEAAHSGPDVTTAVVFPQTVAVSDGDSVPVASDLNPAAVSSAAAEANLGGIPASVTDPRDRWLHEMMNQPVPELDFPGETPLSEILDYLAEHYTQTHGGEQNYRMTIWPNHAALAEQSINSLDELTVSDVRLEGVPLRQALTLIIDKTESLTWDIRDGVFEVTTKEAFETDPKHRVSRVYHVGNVPEVEMLIRNHLRTKGIYFRSEGDSENDEHTTFGAMSALGDVLIVTHNRRAQEAVEEFLQAVGIGKAGQPVQHSAPRTNDPQRNQAAAASGSIRQRTISRAAAESGYIPFGDGPIAVNLNDGQLTRFLSIGFSLKVDPSRVELTHNHMNMNMPALKSWLISHLSDKSLEDIRGREGQNQVRKEIREKFSAILFPEGDSKIEDVLFSNFAVQ